MKKITFIASGIVLFIISYIISGAFLLCNNPIESPYILLEAWIPSSVVEDASQYIQENNIDSVFVIGMKNSNKSISLEEIDKSKPLQKKEDAYALYWDAVLGFEIPSSKLQESFTLNIGMHGTSDNDFFPHFKIVVNNRVIATGFVSSEDSVYKFPVLGKITDSSTYILIHFDNDEPTSIGDRNLYVSSINLNSVQIDSIKTGSFLVPSSVELNADCISKLHTVKYYLSDLGYDTARVRLVEVEYDSFNKSLAIAKGAKQYFFSTEINSINIFTTTIHSRRSYFNFKNCLKKNIEVGCIPGNSNKQKEASLYGGFDERISLLATWIYWWFH